MGFMRGMLGTPSRRQKGVFPKRRFRSFGTSTVGRLPVITTLKPLKAEDIERIARQGVVSPLWQGGCAKTFVLVG